MKPKNRPRAKDAPQHKAPVARKSAPARKPAPAGKPASARKTGGSGKPGASRKAGASAKSAPAGKPTPARRSSTAGQRQRAAARSTRGSGPRPLSVQQAQALLNLEQILSRRIVGKDDAIARISRVIRVRMAMLDFRPDRPRGSFLLVGPTGVGKNELAFAFAEALYGSEDKVVSIDLGEFSEEEDLPKLGVTLLPGTTNQAVEGVLTSPVRRNPEAVILLRGLERAHAAFQPILQQVLERGWMEDLLGPVPFSRSIIFVTTHPRRDDPAGGEIGFSRSTAPPEEILRRRLERGFTPELLDSFNEIIELPTLSTEAVRQVARYKVEAVLKRLHSRNRTIRIDESVFQAFIPEDEVKRQGVTLLHQTLESRLFNPLARYLLSHRQSRSIVVEVNEGNLRIHE
jgi:ATP-dependent Clp protease ATP-binding subunit ClpC